MIHVVDLSLDIYDKAPTFWPDPKTTVMPHMKIENMKYNITQLIISSHIGTHIDAPFHFLDDGKTVDQVDMKKGFGAAWLLDFTHKGPKTEIIRSDLEAYDDIIKPGARIIIHTNWDKVFPDDCYFTDSPGLNPAACYYLAERKIACIAMDMPTVYAPEYVDVHHALLRAEVLIVEGLAHLDTLKSNHVLFSALPLRIKGGDGSPCRAVAIEGLTAEQLQVFE